MNPRNESLSGPSKDSKNIMADAFESADHLVDQVKSKTADLQKQASNYARITADYAKDHPWHVAAAAAGIGMIAGAILFRRKN